MATARTSAPARGLMRALRAVENLVFGARHPTVQRVRLKVQIGEAPLYVIGDVHGCLDLLRDLVAKIDADAATLGARPWIVLVGDIVDRGPNSAQALDFILARQARDSQFICLCGNHEAMMLDFLARPAADHAWLANGGEETLASYGLSDHALQRQDPAYWAHSVPDEHLALLKSLPICLEGEAVFVSHAGIRPGIPLAEQREQDLLWYRPTTNDTEEPPPKIVVHGHQPVDDPTMVSNTIDVDTGAYATGRLTSVRILKGADPVFVEAAPVRGLAGNRQRVS